MSFTLEYDSADPNFGTIDYSGIESKTILKSCREYYLDGQLFVTTSNTIYLFINDFDEHNFTMYFGGEVFTYIFSEDISEAILLPTLSINSIVLWEGIDIPAYNELDNSFDLLWFDGTSWITIESGITADVTGLISIDNLIAGNYMLVETGETYLDAYEEFTISQSTDIYEEVIYLIPETTVIDIDYLNTIFGTDYPVDLTGVDWSLMWTQNYGINWKYLIDYPSIGFYAYLDVSDAVNGKIIIYELLSETGLEDLYYQIVIENTWNNEYDITIDGLTEVDLEAKSISATWTWTEGGEPAVGSSFDLFWFNGVDFEVVGTYVTDTFGMINITEMLPIGTYRFDNLIAFDITVDDILITVNYTVESILGGKSFSLGFCRDTESKHFFFFVFKLNVNWNIMLTLKSPEPLASGFLSFGLHPSSPMHQPTAQFNIGGN